MIKKDKIVVLEDELSNNYYFGYGNPENYLVGIINVIEYNRIVVKDRNNNICGFATIDELFAKANITANSDRAPFIGYDINEEENRTVVTFKLCNHNFERDNEYVPVFSWISDKDNDYFESEAMDIKYPSTIYLNGTVCESHIDSSKNVKTIYNR